MTQALEDWLASAEQLAIEGHVDPEAPRVMKVILASLATVASLALAAGLEIADLKAFLDQWEQEVCRDQSVH